MLDKNCKAADDRARKSQLAIAIYMSNISKKMRSTASNTESGFSLLESLIAVAVVSILIVAIAPMVALSTSARVNARRIDQATQAGRAYIDGVRGGVIDTAGFPDNLVVSTPSATGQYTFESRVAPTTATFPVSTICNNSLATNVPSGKVPGICVDSNGNGFNVSDPQDLFIQPLRSGPLRSVATAANDLRNQGFWLAVRVYRADALAGSALLRDGTEASCAISKTPFSSTASITCPIVTLRSQIYLPTVNPKNIDDIGRGIGSKP